MSNIITHYIIALILCLLSITATAQNIDSLDASGGFEDIKLLDPIEFYIEDLYVIHTDQNIPFKQTYKVGYWPKEIKAVYQPDKSYFIDGYRIDKIQLEFIDKKLSLIEMNIFAPSSVHQIAESIARYYESIFGRPSNGNDNFIQLWQGKQVVLICHPQYGEVRVVITVNKNSNK